MGEFIVEDVHWKKGEEGLQEFHVFESDGTTIRDATGKTMNFAFWKKNSTAVKGSGACTILGDPTNGEWTYPVSASNTDTEEEYKGELIEDPIATKLKSETFKVIVGESSDRS